LNQVQKAAPVISYETTTEPPGAGRPWRSGWQQPKAKREAVNIQAAATAFGGTRPRRTQPWGAGEQRRASTHHLGERWAETL